MSRAWHVFTSTGAMRAWATTLLVIVCCGLALGFTIGYVKRVDRQAEERNVERSREICGLIVLMDDAYQRQRPATALGQQLADEVHRYRLRLGC